MKKMILHNKQQNIVKSKARFKVIRAGRRSGKTTYSIEEMLYKAMKYNNRKIFYLAPTQIQARKIIWEALKSRLGGIGETNESRLEITVPTEQGGTSLISVAGWENRENFRGLNADLIVFDELDTMKDFFISFQEIFRPALADTKGEAIFIGTPKKENPNLRRLEKQAEKDFEYQCFHFKTEDNPHIDRKELENLKSQYDYETWKQEFEAEYLDNQGALFRYTSLIDVFSNTIDKSDRKYLSVDIADDGSDKTKFSYWEGLEEIWRESFERLNTESIISKIREYASQYKIPYPNIVVDAIGVGAGVASSSLLDGIIGYKSSYSAIKTDDNISSLNQNRITPLLTTDYKNLRSQCIFTLADFVNNHKIASKCEGKNKESIIEELSAYQDISSGDGKRQATSKDEVKEQIGRSPDDSDTWVMRMYFEVIRKVLPNQNEDISAAIERQKEVFLRNRNNLRSYSTK